MTKAWMNLLLVRVKRSQNGAPVINSDAAHVAEVHRRDAVPGLYLVLPPDAQSVQVRATLAMSKRRICCHDQARPGKSYQDTAGQKVACLANGHTMLWSKERVQGQGSDWQGRTALLCIEALRSSRPPRNHLCRCRRLRRCPVCCREPPQASPLNRAAVQVLRRLVHGQHPRCLRRGGPALPITIRHFSRVFCRRWYNVVGRQAQHH